MCAVVRAIKIGIGQLSLARNETPREGVDGVDLTGRQGFGNPVMASLCWQPCDGIPVLETL
ncbi:MAG: hypothetical protein A2289_00955 [Deltaproteobacteria bacterium RIFOXYA12_FULL_58_15]|nr:MAG: hypothetical protein A2289_00955 [Deltaproteobacteria bacterium RIFOXYA12_FULL_58_15]